jgi:Na+-translocating ferredoxin:NAD+ oxidoreductase subunit A
VSYIGIIVTAAFASNALLTYGLGGIPEGRRSDSGSLAAALALAFVDAIASGLLWAIHRLVLAPLGLESLDVLFFAIVAVPLLKFVARLASGSSGNLMARIGTRSEELIVGSLVFGIALLSSRSDYALPEALVAGAASGLGYWLAEFFLEALRERLELSDLPFAFKGAPAMLISAGLMALAFMGIDAAFIKGLAG